MHRNVLKLVIFKKALSLFPICHQSVFSEEHPKSNTAAVEEKNQIFYNCPRVSILDVLRNRCYKLNETCTVLIISFLSIVGYCNAHRGGPASIFSRILILSAPTVIK